MSIANASYIATYWFCNGLTTRFSTFSTLRTLSALPLSRQDPINVVERLHTHDRPVPDDLKAFAKLAFIDRLPSERKKEADPTLEFLNEARKELVSSYGSEADRYPWYFALLRLAFKYAPADAPAILKEAVAALNRADQGGEKDGRTEEVRHNETAGIWKNLPVSLIDMDEYAVKEAVSSITSTQTRVVVRLDLLQASLERMRRTKETGPNSRRTAAKGE